MHITSIKIENFRCFKEMETTFEDDLTVFVAKNGQGKSTVLDAIKILLWPYVSGFDLGKQTNEPTGIEVCDILRKKTEAGNMEPVLPASISAKLTLHTRTSFISDRRYRDSIDRRTRTKDGQGTSELKKKAAALQKKIFSENLGQDIQLPIVAYYGTGRLWNMRKLMSDARDDNSLSRTFGYRGCLDPSSTFKYFAEWYTQIFKSYRDAQIIALERNIDNSEEIEKRRIPVKVVQRCINAVIADLTGWKDIRYSTQENALTLSHESLGELNVDQLSDGIRNIFAVVADIAYRCLLLNPALGENAAQETSGIVLIDEVDMHLHPAWQQTILSDLRKAFPRIQFIVTTHSPQVLSSIETRHIRMLENGCCVPCEGSTYGAESSRILEEVFGISLRAKTASREALDTYLALIQQGEHDSQQARDLRAQLDKWLYGDPILDNADMLIRRAERQKAREPGRA